MPVWLTARQRSVKQLAEKNIKNMLDILLTWGEWEREKGANKLRKGEMHKQLCLYRTFQLQWNTYALKVYTQLCWTVWRVFILQLTSTHHTHIFALIETAQSRHLECGAPEQHLLAVRCSTAATHAPVAAGVEIWARLDPVQQACINQIRQHILGTRCNAKHMGTHSTSHTHTHSVGG